MIKKINYLLYRFKWHLANYIQFKNPIHLDLELSAICNQKCRSCWHFNNSLKTKNKFMSFGVAKIYLDQAKQIGIKSVKFNWRGESLLNPDFFKIIEYAKSLNFIDLMLNTNGTLLSNINEAMAITEIIDTLIISVDSVKENNYCYIHNCDITQFYNLKDCLDNLKFLKKDKLIKTKIKLNFHINILNQCENIYKIKKQYPDFKIIERYTEKREGQNISNIPQRKRKNYCPHIQKRLVISIDGKIYPCCVAYNDQNDLQLGFKNSLTLKDAWNSFGRFMIIKNIRKKTYYNSCLKCTSGDIYK
jgi:radical SAM protein with 4Fe4S-binding SPASM domain